MKCVGIWKISWEKFYAFCRWREMINWEDTWLRRETWSRVKFCFENFQSFMVRKCYRQAFVLAVIKISLWTHWMGAFIDVLVVHGRCAVLAVKSLIRTSKNAQWWHQRTTSVPSKQTAQQCSPMRPIVSYSHWGYFCWNEANQKCEGILCSLLTLENIFPRFFFIFSPLTFFWIFFYFRFEKIFAELESHVDERIASGSYKYLKAHLVPFVQKLFSKSEFSERMILTAAAILDNNCFEINMQLRRIEMGGLFLLSLILCHDCVPNTKHFVNFIEADVDIKRYQMTFQTTGKAMKCMWSHRNY